MPSPDFRNLANAALLRILHSIQPFWLREKLFYRLNGRLFRLTPDNFRRAPLALVRGAALDLEPHDVGHQVIAGTGLYENAVSVRIVALAREGGLLADVGANYGYYAVMWAALSSENRVVAFEASPDNARALQRNIVLNGLTTRVAVIDKAVGRESGFVYFQPSMNGETGQGGLAPTGMVTDLRVEMTTLDDHFGPSQTIDVLKIDAEGADPLVLEGAEQLLRERRIRHIFFEHFEARMEYLGIGRNRPFEILTRYGYTITSINPGEYYACAPVTNL
jgi:FkbM family methyltransferase